MSALFDGMATTLTDVFGDAVMIYPGGGLGRWIGGILREQEVEVATEEGGAVLSLLPVLKAPASAVEDLRDGDAVEISDRVTGARRRWTVLYRIPAVSPAADRFEAFALRKEIT